MCEGELTQVDRVIARLLQPRRVVAMAFNINERFKRQPYTGLDVHVAVYKIPGDDLVLMIPCLFGSSRYTWGNPDGILARPSELEVRCLTHHVTWTMQDSYGEQWSGVSVCKS